MQSQGNQLSSSILPVEPIGTLSELSSIPITSNSLPTTSSLFGSYKLFLKTVQTNTFRLLIDTLKDKIPDCNFHFNENGLKVITIDSKKSELIHVKLKADKFEQYYCPSALMAGINLCQMYKFIKSVNNSDTLTIYIKRSDPNNICIKIENGGRTNFSQIYTMNILDLDDTMLTIPSPQFNFSITMQSSNFQKIISSMLTINPTGSVEIRSISQPNMIIFSSKKNSLSVESIVNAPDIGDNIQRDDIVQGEFPLRQLHQMTKCTNISADIKIILQNNFPIIIIYQVGTLGEVKFVLAPKQNEM